MVKCLECEKEFIETNKGRKKKYCSRKCGDKAKHRRYLEENKIVKVCEFCRKQYSARNKTQKYCSDSCSSKGTNNYEIIKNREYIKSCKVCDKEFTSLYANSKFCSSECKNSQYTHVCKHCNVEFKSKEKKRLFCSDKCSLEHTIKNECFCQKCGKRFMGDNRRANKFCSRDCFYEYANITPAEVGTNSVGRYTDAHHIKRAKKFGVLYQHIKPIEIYERDNWKCGICNAGIDMNLCHPHPMSASIDHIIPLSKGGTHTESNVQSAHLKCNIYKSDRLKF